MKLYFAYGSNMSAAQMTKRCPAHQKIGTARLPGCKWIISTRGYANIVRAENEAVEGVLYAISAADESALDGYEGVVMGLLYKETLTVQHDGREMAAMMYIDPTVREGEPNAEYICRMATALLEADLSAQYVTKYMRRVIKDKG